jgi:hypothetical protein
MGGTCPEESNVALLEFLSGDATADTAPTEDTQVTATSA